jgi:hypothetical protein
MTSPRKRSGFAQGIYAYNDSQKERLGTIRELYDGRSFVYCKNGAGALAAGAVCASVITVMHNEQTVTVAHPVGTKTIIMTDSGGGVALDAYKGGTLIVSAGAGIGECYEILGNSAATAGATFEITLAQGLRTLWVTSTTDISIFPNRYNGVITNPTDGQQLPACVPQIIVPIGNFFWGQISGHGSMLIDVAAGASGVELDEKLLRPSLNHAGFAFSDTAPDATKILAGYRHCLGYIVSEEDLTDNEASLVQIRIGQ